jgi:hypothetical protein
MNQPKAAAKLDAEVKSDEGAEHADGTVGEVEHAGGLVDQHNAQRRQRVERAEGDADQGELEE